MAILAFAMIGTARADDTPPPADPNAMLIIGETLSAAEREEAWQFCLDTLAQAPLIKTEPVRTCACFPAQWEALTNRLERLALPIIHAPKSREAHEKLAEIGRAQGGFHDSRLEDFSTAYRAAAQQAMRACL